MRHSRTLAALLVATAILLGGCGGGEPAYEVTVEVVESDAPLDVSISVADLAGRVLRAHTLRVTWRGDDEAVLGDARFVHFVSSDHSTRARPTFPPWGWSPTIIPDDDRALYIAAPDCRWAQQQPTGRAAAHCFEANGPVRLAPGEWHEYTIFMFHPLGSGEVAAGTYVVEEPVAWWHAAGSDGTEPVRPPDGTFTIRLTYEVR